jgi:drug/metabolite transporter (DMT)-like permease
MPQISLTLPAIVGTVTAAFLTAIANMLLRAGILRFGGFSPSSVADVIWQFLGLLLQPLFFSGFVLYFVAALVWFRTIAIAPISVTYPLMVSLTFIAVTAGAFLLWGEPLSLRKLIGLAVILLGIVLVSGEGGAV